MYSGQAVKVMRQRAYAAQLPPTERLSPLQRIMADNRKRDEERLIAERDPAQRAALWQADADAMAESVRTWQKINRMFRPLSERLGFDVEALTERLKADPDSGYYPDAFARLLALRAEADPVEFPTYAAPSERLQRVQRCLHDAYAYLVLQRRHQAMPEPPDQRPADVRTLTLTAPHGPDLCGVPVAA